jgi:hypothetical protein
MCPDGKLLVRIQKLNRGVVKNRCMRADKVNLIANSDRVHKYTPDYPIVHVDSRSSHRRITSVFMRN